MNIPDIVNGCFEFGASVAVLAHCWAAYKDKRAQGVSTGAVAYMFAWGVWNLFYYPHLGQFWSFVGGLFIVAANVLWVSLLIYYRRSERIRIRCFDNASPGIRRAAKALADAVQRINAKRPT